LEQDTGIALLALFTAVLSAYLTRVHNRLAVKPYLRFDFHYLEDNVYTIEFINCGLGPAILKSMTIIYKGDTFNVNNKEWFLQIYNRIVEENKELKSIDYKYNVFVINDVFSPNEKKCILEFSAKNPALFSLFFKILIPNINIDIRYTSVYKDRLKLLVSNPL
jgi:hypothetical protein